MSSNSKAGDVLVDDRQATGAVGFEPFIGKEEVAGRLGQGTRALRVAAPGRTPAM